MAVDSQFIGLGTPVFVDGTAPGERDGEPDRPLQRLMIAQDTGGAITGALRGDIFWGSGDAAAYRAGVMNASARFYVLLPVGLAERIGQTLVAKK